MKIRVKDDGSSLVGPCTKYNMYYSVSCGLSPGREIIKLFSCSTQLSTNLILHLIKTGFKRRADKALLPTTLYTYIYFFEIWQKYIGYM